MASNLPPPPSNTSSIVPPPKIEPVDASTLAAKKRSLFQIGPPLAGKTRVALTCPKPVWIADLDQNSGSLSDAKPGEILTYRFETKATGKIGRDQHRPRDSSYALRLIDWINSIYDLDEEHAPKVLMIDSLGPLGMRFMEFALALNNREEPVYQDWGQAMGKIREFVEAGIGLPYTHFILNAHEAMDKDEFLGKIYLAPDTIGKLAGQLGGLFDAVMWVRKETDPQGNTKTMWLTVPDGFVKQAGVRDKITPKTVEARWENIFPLAR